MIVQAEVSLYPLNTENLREPIETSLDRLNGTPLEVQTSKMSTIMSWGMRKTFDASPQSSDYLKDACVARV